MFTFSRGLKTLDPEEPEKSIRIDQRLTDRCRLAAAALLTAISTGNYSPLPSAAHSKLVAFSKEIVSKGRVATLSGFGGPNVEISASHPVPENRPKLVKHNTTIYGKIVSIGGIKSYRASLVLSKTGKSLDVTVGSEELIKQLAQRMYEVVGVKGAAWTDLQTGDLKDFRIESLTRFRGDAANPVAALSKIATDFPDAWSGVDVPVYISELRDGGDA